VVKRLGAGEGTTLKGPGRGPVQTREQYEAQRAAVAEWVVAEPKPQSEVLGIVGGLIVGSQLAATKAAGVGFRALGALGVLTAGSEKDLGLSVLSVLPGPARLAGLKTEKNAPAKTATEPNLFTGSSLGQLATSPLFLLLGVGGGGTGIVGKGPRRIPWSSKSVSTAADQIRRGPANVTVSGRDEAGELFLGIFHGRKYRDTTGMSATEVKERFGTKAGTYHWDVLDTEHGGRPHLQIHDDLGRVFRIFY